MAFRSKLVAIMTGAVLLLVFSKFMFTAQREPDELPNVGGISGLHNDKRLIERNRISSHFVKFQNKSKNTTLSVKAQNLPKPGNGNKFGSHGLEDVEADLSVDTIEENYMLFITGVKDSEIQNPFLNQHQYNFLLNNEYACNGQVFLLVLVHSSAAKSNERTMIRKTWGSVRFYSGAVIVPLFLLGQVAQDNGKLQEDITKESNTYRDIIQANFIDSYKNLTIKNVMGLHWVQTHCTNAKFVLKTDDDTMVDIYHLVNFLFQKSPDGNLENFLYCSVYRNQGPVRRTDDKWFVTQSEYPYSKYPPYCEGFAYVMSYDVSKKLYEASRSVKFYWIDDVLVTGFMALKAGVYHRNLENGHSYNLMQSEHLSKHVQSSIFLLAKYNHMQENWEIAWNDIQTVNEIAD